MKPFAAIIAGKLQEFDRWEEIPAEIDHLVRFAPIAPPQPHTAADHEAAAVWLSRLGQVMGRERASGNENRRR